MSKRGEKSLAGLTAQPAVRPRLAARCEYQLDRMGTYLRWMEVRPKPIISGTRLLGIFMLFLSVTARMMTSSMAVPSIWSMARLMVLICRTEAQLNDKL